MNERPLAIPPGCKMPTRLSYNLSNRRLSDTPISVNHLLNISRAFFLDKVLTVPSFPGWMV